MGTRQKLYWVARPMVIKKRGPARGPVLAAVVLPMVLRTAFLAFKNRFRDHMRIARWTFPIWVYVSVTGVVVYVMLYH